MKKFLNFIIITLLMSFTFGTVAHAAETKPTNYDPVLQRVEYANKQINLLIEQSIIKGNIVMEEYNKKSSVIGLTDEQAAVLIAEKDSKLDKIINDLQRRTSLIAENTVNFAAKYNVTIKCELIEVHIGDRDVFIDPLRVLND